MDEIVATGPVPALVMALTLKVYEVNGFKPGTSIVVAVGSATDISFLVSGPTTCTVYPVTIFCCSSGRGFHETSAVVGSL